MFCSGVSDVSSDVAVENDLATDERIGDVGFVVARDTVPPGKPGPSEVALPAALHTFDMESPYWSLGYNLQ